MNHDWSSTSNNVLFKFWKPCIWPLQQDLIMFTIVKTQNWPPYLYVSSHGSTLLLWCCIEQIWRCKTGVWVQSISFYRHLVLPALSTLRPLHWRCCTPSAPQPSPLHTLPVSAARLKQTQHTKAPQCHSLRAKRVTLLKPRFKQLSELLCQGLMGCVCVQFWLTFYTPFY